MAHQVLEEYNSLPTTQTTNRVPQNLTSTYYWSLLKTAKATQFDSKFGICKMKSPVVFCEFLSNRAEFFNETLQLYSLFKTTYKHPMFDLK